eukprot:9774762-Heterocapsa_arctica.AAC.1
MALSVLPRCYMTCDPHHQRTNRGRGPALIVDQIMLKQGSSAHFDFMHDNIAEIPCSWSSTDKL